VSDAKPPGRVGRYPEATTRKVSISLDIAALEWAQEVARAEGRSVSAVISEAVNEARARQADVVASPTMKRTDFKDTQRFEVCDEQSLSEIADANGAPLKVQRYREKATGQLFQVSEAANRYRQTTDASETVTGTYGEWKPLR
jgi:hypothetical protein